MKEFILRSSGSLGATPAFFPSKPGGFQTKGNRDERAEPGTTVAVADGTFWVHFSLKHSVTLRVGCPDGHLADRLP